MKLLRLVTAYFDPEPEGWSSWEYRIGRVKVQARPVNRTDVPQEQQAKRGRLLIAEIDLSSVPTPGPDGLLEVPDRERRWCEQAIEATANLVSVLTRSQRRLSSPWPPIALLPETSEERVQLEAVRAFRYSTPSSTNAIPPALKPEPELMAGLIDRLDGVQSIATFNTELQPLARYREAVRFLEMAYARPIRAIEKKLARFLGSGKFGYTREEVAEWISHRHGATHADSKPYEQIVWDADVAHFMDRMEQALYDVLLNKEKWHDSSQNRRDLWRPLAGTSDDKGGLFVTEKTGGIRIECQIFDAFKSYPHDMSANINKPPAEWWCRFPEEALQSGEMEITVAETSVSSSQPSAETNPASAPHPAGPAR